MLLLALRTIALSFTRAKMELCCEALVMCSCVNECFCRHKIEEFDDSVTQVCFVDSQQHGLVLAVADMRGHVQVHTCADGEQFLDDSLLIHFPLQALLLACTIFRQRRVVKMWSWSSCTVVLLI